jgi:hypothetical protein
MRHLYQNKPIKETYKKMKIYSVLRKNNINETNAQAPVILRVTAGA